MDFAFSDSQRDLAERVGRFVRERLRRPPAGSGFDRARWRALGEFGLLGLSVPAALGGLGLDALDTACAMEAFGGAADDFGLVFSAAAHLFACVMPLVHHGSDAQRARWVPGLVDGTLVGANAISEAGAGSDIGGVAARAVVDGDGFVLDGVKTFVTNGPVADLFLIYAATAPEDGLFGLSAFVVPREARGVTLAPAYGKPGLESAPLGALQLDGCRVGRDALLGQPGQGKAIFATSMLWERSCLFAGYLGAMATQLARSLDYARQRRQFGRPIGGFQAVSHRLVDMKLRLEAARLLVYRAAWAIDRGSATRVTDVALAKLAVSEAAVQSALDAIRIHGGMGVTNELGVARALWESVPSLIFSGTSEIQKEIVARELGL